MYLVSAVTYQCLLDVQIFSVESLKYECSQVRLIQLCGRLFGALVLYLSLVIHFR